MQAWPSRKGEQRVLEPRGGASAGALEIPGPRAVLLCLVLVLTIGSAAGAQRLLEPFFETSPQMPTDLDPIVLVVTVESGHELGLGTVATTGARIAVELAVVAPCLILCPPTVQRVEVPLGRLPAGSYEVVIDLADTQPIVGELEVLLASPYRTTMRAVPTAPTVNDWVGLAFGLAVESCFAPEPTLHSVAISTSSDPSIHVVLTSTRPGIPCEAEDFAPVALAVPLGGLPAGSYQVLVDLIEIAAPSAESERDLSLDSLSPLLDRAEARPIGRFDLLVAEADEVVLLDGRFEVRSWWWTVETGVDQARPAGPVPSPDPRPDAAVFSFFGQRNWELLLKVLDGCSVNGHHWVYAASATDVGTRIEVRDVLTGSVWTRERAPGPPAPAITDSQAFPCQ